MIAEGPHLSTRHRAPPVHVPRRSRFLRNLILILLVVGLAGIALWIGSLYREMQAITPLAQTFNCTVYYTPLENAFTPGKKFNLDAQTRPGLEGISYPADFLKAVTLEGFGRIKNPVKGRAYIFYNGSWGYAEKPMGNHSNPLQPKMSCAISSHQGGFSSGDWVILRSKSLPLKIESRPWRVDDVGAGVGKSQIDLYWGEDAPLGPGSDLERPAGIDMTRVKNIMVCVLPGDTRLRQVWSALHELPFPALAMHGLNPMLDRALAISPVLPAPEEK